jgi:hypothetical protein
MPKSKQQQEDETNGRRIDYSRTYEFFGVAFHATGNPDEVEADECPFCSENRFHVNITSGLYHCKKCDAEGNVTTFLTAIHATALDSTGTEQYRPLSEKRGIAIQTLRSHDLAYTESGCWFIPFRNAKGNVVNIQLYYPNQPCPNKCNPPGLPLCLYGFDKLTARANKDKPVYLCEGPLDAIALDYHLAKHRDRYVVVATPGAFKQEWAGYFQGRKVRALYDNDAAGRQHAERVRKLLGESRVASELHILKWPEGTPDHYDVNDWVKDHHGQKRNFVSFAEQNSYSVKPESRLDWHHGWERRGTPPEKIEWVWENRLRCGSYCSFSGPGGTYKSTIARQLVARYTRGLPMRGHEGAMPAGYVVYFTAEDTKDKVFADVQRFGGDTLKVSVLETTLKGGDYMNMLDHLDELEQAIKQYGVRLVVVDGQNSLVGGPNIATDMLARHNVTNKLHRFAQRLNICLLGIRNEDPTGRALGPQSMGDIARCVMKTIPEKSVGDCYRYFRLTCPKVSDSAPCTHTPIPYAVEDRAGKAPTILWGRRPPEEKTG